MNLYPPGRTLTSDAFDRWWAQACPDDEVLFEYGIKRLTGAVENAKRSEATGSPEQPSADEIAEHIRKCETDEAAKRQLIKNQAMIEKLDGGLRAFCAALFNGKLAVLKMAGGAEMQIDAQHWIGYEAERSISAGRDYKTQELLFVDTAALEGFLRTFGGDDRNQVQRQRRLQDWAKDYASQKDRIGKRPDEQERLTAAREALGNDITRKDIRNPDLWPDHWRPGRPKNK